PLPGVRHTPDMLGALLGRRPLDEGVGVDPTAEALLEAELRERDLARCLRRLDLCRGTLPDSMRLAPDSPVFERRELVPVDRLVADAERPQSLLVRQRTI